MTIKPLLIFFFCLLLVLGMAALSPASQKQLLAQRHAGKNVSCQDCHSDDTRVGPCNSACISCHGTIEKMAALTTVSRKGLYMENVNPHKHHPAILGENIHSVELSGYPQTRSFFSQYQLLIKT